MSTTSTPRVAIVTGGASGIGFAIAERLAADGHTVAIFDRDAAAAEAAANKLGGGGYAVDVTDRAAIDGAVATVVAQHGAPTILVNNAGLQQFGAFLTLSLDEWQRVLDVNLTGTFHCCQAVIPHMIEARWGRIVNISSSSAQGGQPFMTHYVSSKAGLIGMTKALALEFGSKGITVNTIPPGFIDTPMLRSSEEKGLLGGTLEETAEKTPVRRAGTPDDIAYATSFLVSEEASYITGQVIGVNGGRNT